MPVSALGVLETTAGAYANGHDGFYRFVELASISRVAVDGPSADPTVEPWPPGKKPGNQIHRLLIVERTLSGQARLVRLVCLEALSSFILRVIGVAAGSSRRLTRPLAKQELCTCTCIH